MKIKERKVQFPNRKKVKKYDENLNVSEEYCVDLESEEGDVIEEGTTINKNLLEQINWRDDDQIAFESLAYGEEQPKISGTKTIIYTKSNGETWVVPRGETSNSFKLNEPNALTNEIMDTLTKYDENFKNYVLSTKDKYGIVTSISNEDNNIELKYVSDTVSNINVNENIELNTVGKLNLYGDTVSINSNENIELKYVSDTVSNINVNENIELNTVGKLSLYGDTVSINSNENIELNTKKGKLDLYGNTGVLIKSSDEPITFEQGASTINLPNKSGTVALTSSDITGTAKYAINDEEGNNISNKYIKKGRNDEVYLWTSNASGSDSTLKLNSLKAELATTSSSNGFIQSSAQLILQGKNATFILGNQNARIIKYTMVGDTSSDYYFSIFDQVNGTENEILSVRSDGVYFKNRKLLT